MQSTTPPNNVQSDRWLFHYVMYKDSFGWIRIIFPNELMLINCLVPKMVALNSEKCMQANASKHKQILHLAILSEKYLKSRQF